MEIKNMLLKIKPENTNQRLDKFVKEQFPDLSRSFLQKAIEAGQVLVNGKKTSVHFFLKIGDKIEIKIEPPKEIKVEANPEVKILSKCPPQIPLNPPFPKGDVLSLSQRESQRGILTHIIHEEPDFVVINKPVGLVVHQGEKHKEPDTLVNGLLARFPEIAKIGEDLLRPGIVHRLDKDASGIMVIARNQTMFDHLKKQFKLRQTKKEYLALVHGEVSPPQGVIEFAVERQGAKMVARAKGGEGKEAMTEYEVINPSPQPSPAGRGGRQKIPLNPPLSKGDAKGISLLRLITRTGRTHQIRVHLFALGHPTVGDLLYKQKLKANELKNLPTRLMLHAQKLGFYDLAGQWREFEAPTPEEFKMM